MSGLFLQKMTGPEEKTGPVNISAGKEKSSCSWERMEENR